MDMPNIMDIEASGFGRGSYPIEIGYVLTDGRADCMLIQPLADWRHWDADAQALHGISRHQLSRHGRNPQQVAQRLNQALRGLTLYSDAWGHDRSWLGLLFDSVGSFPSFSLQPLSSVLSEAQMARWHDTKEQILWELNLQRHRASTDARILQQTWLRTLRQSHTV